MSLRLLMTLAVLALVAGSALAQPAEPVKARPDTPEAIRKVLQTAEVKLDGVSVADTPVMEVLTKLAKQHPVTFLLNEEQFIRKNDREFRHKKSPLKQFDMKGLTAHQFLNVWLASLDAMYLVRADYVEIVPLGSAAPAPALPLARPGSPPPPAPGGGPLKRPDGKPARGAEAILKTLHSDEVKFEGNVNDMPFLEMLSHLSKQHEVTFIIMEEQFREMGIADIRDRKPSLVATDIKGMTLHRFLTVCLATMNAMYQVREDYIAIVPLPAVTGQAAELLVSVVVKEKPFTEVVEKLAEDFDLSVVIAPQAGDGKAGFVSARLKNVPPETALELLAVQCDLRVVRKGNAFLITSRDHADELFHEQMERERQKIELQKFRDIPPPKPEPPPSLNAPAGVVPRSS
jgi:hypothetical protein